MKMHIMIVAIISASFMYGMEQENKWSLMLYGVNINLIKGNVLDYYADENKKTDIIICVGKQKQKELGALIEIRGPDDKPLETCWWKPEKDSLYYEKAQSNNWWFVRRKGIVFLCIFEPQVLCPVEGSKLYVDDQRTYYKGENAVAMSYLHLSNCYSALLSQGMRECKEIKNIAFPMLGADFGYKNSYVSKEDTAPIAITTVLDWLKENRGAYKNVEFFVDEDSDFGLYKETLREQYYELTAKICLFLFAQQDSASTLLVLPRDVMHYITKLISHN